MKRIIFSFQSVLLALAATVHAQPLSDVLTDTNGTIVAPTNFWQANVPPLATGLSSSGETLVFGEELGRLTFNAAQTNDPVFAVDSGQSVVMLGLRGTNAFIQAKGEIRIEGINGALAPILASDIAAEGSVTIGDASGDTATINAGTFTAPNATNVGATAVANVGALDARYSAGRGKKGAAWSASSMFGYNNATPVTTAYLSGRMVVFTNGQAGQGLENFLPASEWAGKTVRVEAVGWASDASGGLVPLRMRVIWTTNATNNGGYALSMGGNFAGFVGDTNNSVYAAPTTATNPALWQSPAGTIPTNAVQIIAGLYIARNATNNTATNTIYLQEIRVTEQ